MNTIIEPTSDYKKLEMLAKQHGQEVSPEISKRIQKGWFAYDGDKIVGGIGIFKWDDCYTIEYSFATASDELKEKLLNEVIKFAKDNKIRKIYYIRGEPEQKIPIEVFNFKEIHWRNLPPAYRDFDESLCDKCPPEIKNNCNPIAMVLEL